MVGKEFLGWSQGISGTGTLDGKSRRPTKMKEFVYPEKVLG